MVSGFDEAGRRRKEGDALEAANATLSAAHRTWAESGMPPGHTIACNVVALQITGAQISGAKLIDNGFDISAKLVRPSGVNTAVVTSVLGMDNLSSCDGYHLVAIGGEDTYSLSHADTTAMLDKAARPCTLHVVAPPPKTLPPVPRGADKDLWTAYTSQDPSGRLPECVCLLLSDYGLHIVARSAPGTDDGYANVCVWPWAAVNLWKPHLQSRDPNDMELLMIGVDRMGYFAFQCNGTCDFQARVRSSGRDPGLDASNSFLFCHCCFSLLTTMLVIAQPLSRQILQHAHC